MSCRTSARYVVACPLPQEEVIVRPRMTKEDRVRLICRWFPAVEVFGRASGANGALFVASRARSAHGLSIGDQIFGRHSRGGELARGRARALTQGRSPMAVGDEELELAV